MVTNIEAIDPQLYFDQLKDKQQHTNDEFLQNLYSNSQVLLQKAFALGQDVAVRKLLFTIDVIEKEKKLLDMGFKSFVYRDDVEFYIDNVADKVVKIIELKNYPREIPDEIAEAVIRLKEEKIFDDYLVVFTDYTGEVERQVVQEKRRKDPILFGIFGQENSGNLHDRFYYIADWEDEYCNLTLAKMISDMADKGKTIENNIGIKEASIDEIKEYITSLTPNNDRFRLNRKPENGFFNKIKTWMSKNG